MLIGRMLKAKVVMSDGVKVSTEEGVPQGGPLSPLLSNVVLDELDWELDRRGHRFVRYADDSNVYVQSERAGRRVMASLTDFIERRLRLKVEALLRREGIYSSHLAAWRKQLDLRGSDGLAARKLGRKPKLDAKDRRISDLEKRNSVLERKLNIAEKLIELPKTASNLLTPWRVSSRASLPPAPRDSYSWYFKAASVTPCCFATAASGPCDFSAAATIDAQFFLTRRAITREHRRPGWIREARPYLDGYVAVQRGACYAPVVTPELEKQLRHVLVSEPAIRVAYAFGSQVKGRPRADSDLDLAVLFDRSLSASAREAARRRLLVALSHALGPLGERADIVDLDRAGGTIAFQVVRDGRRLMERDAGERVRLEAWIARRYDDEAQRRELFRHAARRAGARMGERARG